MPTEGAVVPEVARLEARARALQAMLEASLAIGAASPSAAPGLVFDWLGVCTTARRALWFPHDAATGGVALAGVVGIEPADVELYAERMATRVGDLESAVGLAATTRAPMLVLDCGRDPRWRPVETVTRAAYAVPVQSGARLHGVIVVLGTAPLDVDADARHLVDLYAYYAGAWLGRLAPT